MERKRFGFKIRIPGCSDDLRLTTYAEDMEKATEILCAQAEYLVVALQAFIDNRNGLSWIAGDEESLNYKKHKEIKDAMDRIEMTILRLTEEEQSDSKGGSYASYIESK